jgi:uncharacterized protein with GYD domain
MFQDELHVLPKLDRARCQECKRGQQTISSLQEHGRKIGRKLLSAYVTTDQYDVVLTLEMPNGEAMIKFASRHLWLG